jgi:O-antigen ligase
VAALILYGAHAAYGANQTLSAVVLAAVEALGLTVLLATRWGRGAFHRARPLALPAVAFALVVAVVLWSLTPLAPGGVHPAWSYAGVTGASVIDRSATVSALTTLLGAACALGAGYALGRSDERARLAVNLLLWLGALYAFWALVTYAGGMQFKLHDTDNRLRGSFLSANSAGTLFASLTVLAVSLALSAARKSRRPDLLSGLAAAGVPLAIALLCAVDLILTGSRTAVVTALVAIALIFALEALAGRLKLRTTLVAVGFGILLVIAQGALLISRIGEKDAGHNGRDAILTTHWQAFLDSPILGYGLGSFDTVNKLHLTEAEYPALWHIRAAHNVYLQWLEEAGLVGALAMFACIGLLLFNTSRAMGRRRRSKTLLRGLLAVNLVFLLHGWTDYALEVPSLVAFWAVLLGLQLGLSNASSSKA